MVVAMVVLEEMVDSTIKEKELEAMDLLLVEEEMVVEVEDSAEEEVDCRTLGATHVEKRGTSNMIASTWSGTPKVP